MSNPEKSAPTHRAYIVTKADDGKDAWSELGALWPTKNGNGLSLKCKGEVVITPQTRIIIRARTVAPKKGGAA